MNLSIPQRQMWVFRTKELMLKSGSAVPEGSLVYVREGSSAFLRTPTGWSRLLVPSTPLGVPHRVGGAGSSPGSWICHWGSRALGRSWLLPKPSLCSLLGAAGGFKIVLCW